MPNYTVVIQRTTEHSGEVSIVAENEEDAENKANKLIAALDAGGKVAGLEWSLEDTNYDTISIDEE